MGWSKELQKVTKEAFVELQPHVFMRENRAHMKHFSREGKGAYGYVDIKDALADDWTVQARDGSVHKFESIEKMIEDGWALD